MSEFFGFIVSSVLHLFLFGVFGVICAAIGILVGKNNKSVETKVVNIGTTLDAIAKKIGV